MNPENARRLLFEVADTLDEIGVEYMLYGGTLLGAVREKAFIAIDRDVDLAMLQEHLTAAVAGDIVDRLARRHIVGEAIDHRHKAAWSGGVFAVKFRGLGVHGDLSAFRSVRGNRRAVPSHAGSFWICHEARFLEEIGSIEFLGRTFRCPADVDGFLTEKYGAWRIPHKVFNNVSHPAQRWPEARMRGVIR
ncbi:MAG: LicD family protein [Candidatus Omnitrophica bacterium]|jgi:hypothetical protein|nr:LicD family protein [Candidatus Omnitrophota bacterium]